MLEVLERRDLLAVDLHAAPWQNQLNPVDVNFDQRVSPLDALVVINNLLVHGSHQLDAGTAPQAVPQAATDAANRVFYVDVSGDNRVTPLDVLIVVNELADMELMLVHTYPTDMAGNPITTIAVGQQFKLRTDVQDIRDPVAPNPGVFGAAADVSFSSSLISLDTGQTVEFDPSWDLVQDTTLVPGRIIGYGAAISPPNTNSTQFLWNVVLTAISPGTQTFTPQFSADPNHDYLLVGIDNELNADEVLFVGDMLNITGSMVSIGDVSQLEDTAAPFNFVVTLSSPATEVVTVSYMTIDGTGPDGATTADNDYLAVTNTLTFSPGQTVRTIPVTVNSDSVIEPNETFTVRLFNPSSGVTIDKQDGIGTILNDDSPVAASISDVSQLENTPTPFNFVVTLSSPSAAPVTVSYMTIDGSGPNGATTADNDYLAATNTLTFSPGQTVRTIPITVNSDLAIEPDETFTVRLFNPSSNATISKQDGIGTIQNDDFPPAASISDVSQAEDALAPFNFVVTLSSPTAAPVTVSYMTIDGSGPNGATTADNDYVAATNTLTFSPGQTVRTIPITVNSDLAIEPDETFTVRLFNPSSNATISKQDGIGTISNDDIPPVVSISDVSQAEDALTPFNFVVTLSSPAAEIVTVSYMTIDGSGPNGATTADNDYVAATNTLTFNSGQTALTIPVTVNSDLNIEPNEMFSVRLFNPSSNATIGKQDGIGTISNDDSPPALSISDAIAAAGINPTVMVFTVEISAAITAPVTVGYATQDGTAAAGIDYDAAVGIVTFQPGGAVSQPINVTILGNAMPRPDKTFFVNLSSQMPSNIEIADGSGIGTIITQGISISDVSVVEGNSLTTAAVFTVTLSRVPDEDVTVFYTTADDTATTGGQDDDYTPASGTLTFTSSIQTRTVTVQVHGDTLVESNERFFVNLSNAQGSPIFDSQGVGTIVNDDGAKVLVRLEVTDEFEVPLADDAVLAVDKEFYLKVYVQDLRPPGDLAGVFQSFMDVTYQSTLIAPVGAPDFDPFFSTLAFFRLEDGKLDDIGSTALGSLPGDPTQRQELFKLRFRTIDVGLVNFITSVADTDLDSGHETLLFLTDEPVAPAAINVVNDSLNIGENVVAVNSVSASESNNLVFTVTRFLPSNEVATVVYRTIDGTATAGQDYVAKTGTLTFDPAVSNTQTITIVVNNDTTDEPDENFSIELINPVNVLASQSPGTGTILDDDGQPTLSAASVSALEGSNVVFTVSLSAASGKTVTVNYRTTDPTSGIAATAGVDYTPTSGSLTFSPGSTQRFVTVATIGDIDFETNETFRLELSDAVNANIGQQGQGTIIDVPPAGISGFVFVDLNNNGIKETNQQGIANEMGIAGATVTVTRPSDGFTQTTVTRDDGSYVFVGLVPGTYTVTETQPGFFTDGRDLHQGIESPFNDRYTDIALAPSDAASGYNFGERGIRAEFIAAFINRRALFASAAVGGAAGTTINAPGTTLNLMSGDIWVSFDGGWDGLRTVEAQFDPSLGNVTMRLYNNSLQEIATSFPTSPGTAALLHTGQTGLPYFLRITGSNPAVTVEISTPVIPGLSLTSTGGGTENQDSPPTTNPPASSSNPYSPTSRFASAHAMAAPESEPLVSSNASDEALADDEDWILETLLA